MPGRGKLGLPGPGWGLGGMGWVMVPTLLLLLLDESKLTTLPLFWGVAEWAEDSWLPKSLSFGNLLVLSSWVWMRAAGRERVRGRQAEGGHAQVGFAASVLTSNRWVYKQLCALADTPDPMGDKHFIIQIISSLRVGAGRERRRNQMNPEDLHMHHLMAPLAKWIIHQLWGWMEQTQPLGLMTLTQAFSWKETHPSQLALHWSRQRSWSTKPFWVSFLFIFWERIWTTYAILPWPTDISGSKWQTCFPLSCTCPLSPPFSPHQTCAPCIIILSTGRLFPFPSMSPDGSKCVQVLLGKTGRSVPAGFGFHTKESVFMAGPAHLVLLCRQGQRGHDLRRRELGRGACKEKMGHWEEVHKSE